jgi:extracellular elastinolytic metalloproteinase
MRNSFFLFIVLFVLFFLRTIPVIAQAVLMPQVKQWVKDNNKKLHLQSNDVAEMQITSTSTVNKLTYAYIQQYYLGLKIHNAIYSLCFNDKGAMVSSTGRFVDKVTTKATNATPSVTAATAVQKAAAYLKLPAPVSLNVVPNTLTTTTYIIFTPAGIAKQNITAELLWLSTDDGKTIQLAWEITIDVLNSADYMYVRVNALNGQIINADNATLYEKVPGKNSSLQKNNIPQQEVKKNQTFLQYNNSNVNAVADAAYKVIPLPVESPSYGSLAIVTDPWLNSGASNPVTVFGWQSDGVTEYNYTRGNNVFAYDDTANLNHPGHSDTSSTPSPSFTFTKTPNFSLQPHVTNNMRAAVTNLFYVTNMMHDISYQYGFDEASGNFQVNNDGRGGIGNDPLKAEAQDGSGTDNANMSTQQDGQSPRMQMYLWDPAPSFVTVNTPAGIAGNYTAVQGAFSTNNLITTPVTGTTIYYNDDAGGTTHLGCGVPANAIAGKIVFIDRGTCNFTQKVKDAQTAGAIGVIMIDNIVEVPIAMSGTDNTITIPAVMISKSDGATLTAQIASGESVTLNPSPMLDGDYDDGVIAHEFTHGISGRLTGGAANPNCLNNAEQGGEGWSDYMALMVTQHWDTTSVADSFVQRPLGTYVLGEPTTAVGLRTYPYTLNFSVDPHTYAEMNGTANGSEVHFIGEIWTSALWDMTWRIIEQEDSIEPDIYKSASTGGNTITLNDVIMGMKLQPCNPGYLDARDAILKADSILYNYRHKCAIWGAFARRGMGYSAQQGSSNSTSDQVAAYDIPGAVILSKTAADSSTSTDTIVYTIKASCGCSIPANVKITDTIPATLHYINSSAGTISGNVLTINPVNFTQVAQTLTFTVNAAPTISGCTIDYGINDDRDDVTIGGFTTAGGWSVSTTHAASPTHSWFATEPTTPSNITLTSAAILLSNQSVFTFNHYFNTEPTYDGGVVEISTNSGSSWQDLGPEIINGNYNAVMDASTTLAGQQAFSGSSNGFEQTMIDLSSFTGQTVMIRFRFTSDNGNSVPVEGWYVDDIQLLSGCVVKNSASIYSNATFLTNASAFTFIKPPATATTIDNFSASKVTVAGKQETKISWTVINESNVARYEIDHSIDTSTWNLIDSTSGIGINSYTTFDSIPLIPGVNYYRLKVYNKDSSITYSNTIAVTFITITDTTIVNSFNGAKVIIAGQQETKISWTVTDESNVAHYEIDHSTNASTWNIMDTTSNTGANSYTIFDSVPVVPGLNYYRLKIYNKDGSIDSSAIIIIDFQDNNTPAGTPIIVQYTLAPNPANDHVRFIDNTQESIMIELYDGTGKKVLSETTNSNTDIDISMFAAGLYYYKVRSAGGYSHPGKLIISR